MVAFIDPSRELIAELKRLDQSHPVDMLNLVKLRDQAAYHDGRQATGREAYSAYGRESAAIFASVGGKIIWSAEPQFLLIGPPEERWDIAFLARYPSGQAFLDMVYNPDYQTIVFHRQAAVETSRLLRTRPQEVGDGFG